MVRITQYDEVVRYDIARDLAGRGRYWTTCYLVGTTLIDTGCAHAAAQFIRTLDGRPVDRILHTHCHEDHIGGSGVVVRERGPLDVLAHPGCVAVLDDPRGRQPLHPYRRVMWGWPERVPARPMMDGDEVQAGPYRFRAIHTPGHSPDHLCFLEPEQGWLFSGDLYVGGRDRALRSDGDVAAIIGSLRRVSRLPLTRLFPGAARVPDDAHQALVSKAAYYEELGERIRWLRGKGRSTAAIARIVCGRPMLIEAVTLGHFSRRNLVGSFLQAYADGPPE